ncbi:alpha-amylase family glycosyl hydrolase [Ornithinibacillus salinisoli]|uniref:Alpha-amylase family glycosyl hydrolase n=1 Tax=Ornithinibacillus salinisoli TaxID=1848459 RepID=A0ABW4VU75_9BACI
MKKISMLIIAIFVIYIVPLGQVSAEESDMNEEIIYSIFVDRFNNGNHAITEQVRLDDPNAYHGGDLEGITLKLDDIKQLGFTAIALSPIFENAPDGYHGYWVEDFFEVEEQFGTIDDLKKLVEEAHERDLKVILEFTPNYVSNNHPAVTDPVNQDWILPDATIDTEGATWTDQVAVLNQDHPEVAAMLMEAAAYWLEEVNIDGYKIHAADQTTPGFLAEFTAHVKNLNPNTYIIADLLSDQEAEHVYVDPHIDAIENTAMYESIIDVFAEVDNPVSDIYDVWESQRNKDGYVYVDDAFTDRFTQKFSVNGRNTLTTWQLALTYMLTTPGVPILFQGSEIPMYGEFPNNQRLVDFNSGEEEIKEFYTRITSMKEEFLPLKYGDFELISSDRGMSIFKRTYQEESMYIAINNDSESRAITVPGIEAGSQLRGLLGDNLVREQDNGEYKVSMAREAAEVFIVEENSGLNWGFITPIVGVFLLFVFGVIILSRKQRKNGTVQK